jgi:vancomycin permeability regulator SanA
MTAINVGVDASLVRAQQQTHEAETILRNEVPVTDLSTDQWLHRAAVLAQLAQVDAAAAVARSNQELSERIAEFTARTAALSSVPADCDTPFRGYRFG